MRKRRERNKLAATRFFSNTEIKKRIGRGKTITRTKTKKEP